MPSVDVQQSWQGDEEGPSISHQMAEEEQEQTATELLHAANLDQPAEIKIEVMEEPYPPQLSQQDESMPAPSSADDVGSTLPQRLTTEENCDVETALIKCLGAVTSLANELCGTLQDFRKSLAAKK